MTSLLSYFTTLSSTKQNSPSASASASASPAPDPAPTRALPASWYTSPHMYDLERRAVFAHRWLFITSTLRIPNCGDWVRCVFAGWDVVVYRGKEGVGAVYNEGLVQGDAQEGVSLWGEEEKQDEEGRGKRKRKRIHTHVDRNGFVWINLDASREPSIPFEMIFKDVDIQARYADIDFESYALDHTYTIPAPYNWKLAAENFNECYHCPTTHPDIPSFLNLESFSSACTADHIQHVCIPTPTQVSLGLNVHSTFYFPMSSMTVGKHFMMVQKFLPRAPGRSVCHYEIYRNRESEECEFKRIADMYARVMQEDKVLCLRVQGNLERGVFRAGVLHHKWERAVGFFQERCREAVCGYNGEGREEDEDEGKEVEEVREGCVRGFEGAGVGWGGEGVVAC